MFFPVILRVFRPAFCGLVARAANCKIAGERGKGRCGPRDFTFLAPLFCVFERAAGAPLAGGLALVDPDAGVLIAFNAAPGTVAPEGQGPYGPYAQALAEMIREGGSPLNGVFERTRLLLLLIDVSAMSDRDPVDEFRTIEKELSDLDSYSAWVRRIQAGQAQQTMIRNIGILGTQPPLKLFAEWTDRIAAGELPKSQPQRAGS